jgi:CheY-like chemotaxis protein
MHPERTSNVLIIDADNVRRGMLACTLPAARYSLEFASSAEKGLDLLVRLEPEVVIVGGDHDAHDLCQRVRSLPAGTACTLVLMDERFRDEDLGNAEAGAAGADAYLPFPFEADLLARRLSSPEPSTRPTPLTTSSVSATPAVALDVEKQPREAEPVDPADAWQAFAKKVAQIHEKLDSVDYYKLLQVSRNGTANAIKEAYFSCSMEFHPDRFMRLENLELKAQIYDIFKRMSEAFKVLINPESRARYDDNLSGSPNAENLRLSEPTSGRSTGTPKDPTADAASAAGKKYLHYAILAQSEGKYRSARMYLSMALQYEPDNEALQLRLEEVTQQL